MAITITAPTQGAVNTPIGLTGTCTSGETIGLALSTQNTTPPTKLGPATVAGTEFAGTATPAFAGTWYAWAVDPSTGEYAVSPAITVPSSELTSVTGAVTIGASVPASAVPLPIQEVISLLQAENGSGGVSGAAVTFSVTAATTVSGHTAVAAQSGGIVQADAGTVSMAGAVAGIATTGATAGGTVTVQTAGPITFSGWAWTVGKPIYVGSNGALTQTPPTSGFLQVVALAQAPDTVIVTLESPVLL